MRKSQNFPQNLSYANSKMAEFSKMVLNALLFLTFPKIYYIIISQEVSNFKVDKK
ncbi:MAG: hypothetical protein FWG64_08780 [Firmicutes bacterium]|nr:hypothetical protein [Bacillota bacterium]